jgi:hypothetical protein
LIPAIIQKFEGTPIRALDQDDLVFLARRFRRHPVGRVLENELRQRAKRRRDANAHQRRAPGRSGND